MLDRITRAYYNIIIQLEQEPKRSKGEWMNSASIFKSYLRRLLQDLKDLNDALKNKEYEKAEKMTETLIDDTQKGIEDN